MPLPKGRLREGRAADPDARASLRTGRIPSVAGTERALMRPQPVITRLGFDLLFIEGKMALALDFQLAPVTFVTN